MNRFTEILIILGILAIVLLAVKLSFAYGWPDAMEEGLKVWSGKQLNFTEMYEDQNIEDAIDYFVNSTMLSCAILWEESIDNKYAYMCDTVMDALHSECELNYFSFCFGPRWENFDKQKHVNPPFCKSKQNKSGVENTKDMVN